MNHRLFVALRPPPHIRAQLQGLMGGVSGARWQDDAQLHLTLRYIGEVEHSMAEEIDLALSSLRSEPVSLSLTRVGQFDRKGRCESLWAGVTPKEGVTLLHKKIDRILVALGLEPEHRSFLPHITVARMNRVQSGTGEWLAAHSGLASEPFLADALILYESHLTGEGAQYEPVARYSLKASSRV
jgi:RNA 2',3'-cyclic 3'-phosphodiesterase